MSIYYCNVCEAVSGGDVILCASCDTVICIYCGGEASSLPTERPTEYIDPRYTDDNADK